LLSANSSNSSSLISFAGSNLKTCFTSFNISILHKIQYYNYSIFLYVILNVLILKNKKSDKDKLSLKNICRLFQKYVPLILYNVYYHMHRQYHLEIDFL